MRKYSELRTNIYIAGYVLALMLLCVSSSPLINTTGTDSSVFLTMGRGMLAGKVMYKELFDHKGLYIYFINALAALIGGKSLLGLFIIESIFMFISARIVYALFSAHTSEKVSWLGLQIFMMIALRRGCLEGGNFTEEYTLMFQLCSIYLVAKYLDSGSSEHPSSYMLLHGISAGIVFFLRPNMIMMWGAIAVLVGIDLLRHGHIKVFFKNVFAGLMGMLIGTAPVIIYLVMNDAVNDAIFAVFTYNTIYTASGLNLHVFLRRIITTLANKGQILLIGSIFLSGLIMIAKRRAIYFSAMLFMCIISVSLSGMRYGHYYMQLLPFCLPFAYQVSHELHLLADSSLSMLNRKIIICGVTLATIALGTRIYLRDIDTKAFIKHNEPYYSSSEKVLVTGNRTILYNALGVEPHIKYFYIPTMPETGSGNKFFWGFPEGIYEQTESLISGENDVIIMTSQGSKKIFEASGRGEEAKEVLNDKYILLYHDEKEDILMYGRK